MYPFGDMRGIKNDSGAVNFMAVACDVLARITTA